MLQLLKPFWTQILKFGGIALGVFLFWLQAKKSGEQTIKQQNLENTLKGVQERDRIEVINLSADDDKLDKLRRKWER